MFTPGSSDGDKYFHVYNMSRLKGTDLMKEFDSFGDMSLKRAYMPTVAEGYQDFKKSISK